MVNGSVGALPSALVVAGSEKPVCWLWRIFWAGRRVASGGLMGRDEAGQERLEVGCQWVVAWGRSEARQLASVVWWGLAAAEDA